MGFWIFMLICDLLVPGVMIGFGWVFRKHPPKKINELYGYRTKRSKRNEDTWLFAQTSIGKLWWRIGWIMLPVSALPLLWKLGADTDAIGFTGAVVCLVQCVVILLSLIPVERALERTFDENGNRR